MNKRQSLALITILLSLCTTVVCLRRYSDDLSVLENDEDDLFCAVMNPATGTYIDLSQLSSTPNKLKDGGKSRSSDPSKTRWLVSGWGYNTNFTIGVCSSPVTKDEETHLTNTTGAFYQDPKTHQLISIGDFATTPTLLRSKKLTLKYQNGDKCPNGVDRKSTLLNFVCDKELSSKAQITYIGSLHDCSYFFEVRSLYACPTSNKSNEVNLLGIFVGIFAVFFLVEYGGRRWLYGKVRTHFNPVNSQRPRGEFTDQEPAWRRFLKKIAQPGKRSGPISLNGTRGSREDFLRDMERQNDIIDSLEVRSTATTNGSDN